MGLSAPVLYARSKTSGGVRVEASAIGGIALPAIVVAILYATRKKPGRRHEPTPPTAGEAMRDDWGSGHL
jgi:hypothetical protein